LLKAGHKVTGLDVNRRQVDRLVAAGGTAAADIKAAISGAEIVITMLPAGAQVREVYLDPGGVLANAARGTVLVDCSTIDVETARQVAAVADERGLPMLDAPVSGGVGGAQGATLTFMVGGSDAAFARAKPIIEQMGRTIVHAGGSG